MSHRSLLAALGFISACGLFGQGPHIPSNYQGATQLTVVNAYDHPMCRFGLASRDDQLANWLGSSESDRIAPGQRHTYAVKPGTYRVFGGFCDRDGMSASAGTWGTETATIDGATMIVLGPTSTPPAFHEKQIVYDEMRLTVPPSVGSCVVPGVQVTTPYACCDPKNVRRGTSGNGQPGDPYFCQ